MTKLSQSEIKNQLAATPGWKVTGGALHKDFSFKDFAEAFAFMRQVAELAEKLGHHPDWSNSYGAVSIKLSTHSAGGITDKDFQLALKIEKQLLTPRR